MIGHMASSVTSATRTRRGSLIRLCDVLCHAVATSVPGTMLVVTLLVTGVAEAQTIDTTGTLGVANANHEGEKLFFGYSRIEVDATRSGGQGATSWSGMGWYGRDHDRVWWRTLGDRTGAAYSAAEAQLLYGRYVKTFWDVVVGYRRDFKPAGANYLAVGLAGIAPYWFDVEATAFLSDRGQVSARTQLAVDVLWTQRLVSRPSARVDWAATADRARSSGAGVNSLEVGVQTRYEIRRKFAPYVDLRYGQRRGETRRLFSADGRDAGGVTVRGGLRLIW